jgi:hypothetical protein
MTLSVALHNPTEVYARTFISQDQDHSCVTFTANGQSIQVYFSDGDVWKAKALAESFNSHAAPVPA